ncbi:MAG: response regulator transcription factor [Calditrichia bacterium]
MEERILIVEDDKDMVNLLSLHLNDLHIRVDAAYDGETGLQKALSEWYDLIILDIMLPKKQGTDVCQQIREVNKVVPIIMLTARAEELDKVLGLELGANDYITKPFSIRELIARIKANLRSIHAIKENYEDLEKTKPLEYPGIVINPEKRKVIVNGEKVELTVKEFDLLYYFASHPGRSFTREELLNAVWGYSFEGYDHTVNSHINRLRAKIESDPAHPIYIQTVWGVGYRFAEPEELKS